MMASSIENQERQEIEKIKHYLMDDLPSSASSPASILNDSLLDNTDSTRSNEQQQAEPINNYDGLSMRLSPAHMDVDDQDKESEQISSNNQQNLDYTHENDNNTIARDQIMQPSTTDNGNEQTINAYEYYHQFSEMCKQNIERLKPELLKLGIAAKTADSYLENLPTLLPGDINIATQDPLHKLTEFFRTGLDLFSSFREIGPTDNHNHADPIGEELNETPERAISAPGEHNGNHLNRKIRLPSTKPKATIGTNNFSTLSLRLSKLMEKAKTIVNQAKLFQIEIVDQPQELWKTRTMNCLKNGWCTAIQGRNGHQRHGLGIKWSTLTNINRMNLFVLVQLLSYDNQPHQANVLVPPGTTVQKVKTSGQKKRKVNQRPTLNDLIINDMYGFDRKTRTVLSPITEEEYVQCKKNLQVTMFSLYKTNNEIDSPDDGQDSVDNEDDDKKISVKDELNKLSKLRICLCRINDNGELEYASNYVDTDLIEQSKSTKPLAIDRSSVTPAQLCQCGNETITVTLNTDSEKNGFVICLNNKSLPLHEIHGVVKKQLCFKSRPRETPEQNSLNLKISKESISKTIELNHDPYTKIDENILLNIDMDYVAHSDKPHKHKT